MTTNQLLGEIHGATAVITLASEARPDDVDLQHALRLAVERLEAVAEGLEKSEG